MINFIYILMVAVILGGCSYKNEPINLASYKANYMGETSQDKKKVFIKSVNDMRVDKSSVGSVLNGGNEETVLHSNSDFVKRYKRGLSDALNSAHFEVSESNLGAEFYIIINIKKIKLLKKDESFDKNLKGEIEVEVILVKGKETIKQNFRQKASKWIAPSYTSKDLEPFLYELFEDNIHSIVTRLTIY